MTTTPVSDRLEIRFDLNSLTLGDLETIEEVTGEPTGDWIRQIADAQRRADKAKQPFSPDAKTLLAIVLITLRKTDPAATLADARTVRISTLTSPAAATGEALDPTSPPVDAPGEPKP